LAARKIHCEIFRERFGYRVRFHDAERFSLHVSPLSEPGARTQGSRRHQERVWELPGPSAASDVALVSEEYKLDSAGWRMKQHEIQGARKSPFRR
jgi:hypothetical protein